MSTLKPNVYIVTVFDEPAPSTMQITKLLGKGTDGLLNFNVGRQTPQKK